MKVFFVITFLIFFTLTNIQAQNVPPLSLEWKEAGKLPDIAGRSLGLAGAVSGVTNDVFIVGGGCNFPDSMPWLGGTKKYYGQLYLYHKSPIGLSRFDSTFYLPENVAYAASVSTPSGVMVIGGESEAGVSQQVYLLQWDSTTNHIQIRTMPSLPQPLTGASATTVNNKVFIAGGDNGSATSDAVMVFDLDDWEAGWRSLPSLPHPASHGLLIYLSEKNALHFIGGRCKHPNQLTTFYASHFVFNLASNRWVERKHLPAPLAAGAGVSFAGRYIVLFGGDGGKAYHNTERAMLAIAHEQNLNKRKQLTIEKIRIQSSHPGFCGDEWAYDCRDNRWWPMGCIPFDTPVTTTAVWWNDEVIIAGGEIRAGVRSPKILSVTLNGTK